MTMESYTFSGLYALVSDRVRQLREAKDPRLDIIDQAAETGQMWAGSHILHLGDKAYERASDWVEDGDEARVLDVKEEVLSELLWEMEVEEVIWAARGARDRAGALPVFILGFLVGALGELRNEGVGR